MNSNTNRHLKRCPECKSSKIYRRVRAKVWSDNAKDRKGDTVEKFERLSKAYCCQKCKREFDTPLILDEIIQDEIIQDDINNNVDKDVKEEEEEGKGCIKMEKECVKTENTRKVKIPIDDIMENLIQMVMNQYGVEYDEVKCAAKIKNIIFEIPVLDDALCNEVMPAFSEDDCCASTRGGCLCGLGKGHEGLCICKRCGEEFEIQE